MSAYRRANLATLRARLRHVRSKLNRAEWSEWAAPCEFRRLCAEEKELARQIMSMKQKYEFAEGVSR